MGRSRPGATARPVLPNVNAYTPISPVDYTVMNGTAYHVRGDAGNHMCDESDQRRLRMQRPAAGTPEGANLVSAAPRSAGFSSTSRPIFSSVGRPSRYRRTPG